MKRLLSAIAFCLLPSLAWAQVPLIAGGTSVSDWQDLADCQITSVSSSTGLSSCTGGIPSGTVWAIVTVESNAARWRQDGTAPTSSVGQLLPASSSTSVQQLIVFPNTLSQLKLIPVTGSMTINATFIGQK